MKLIKDAKNLLAIIILGLIMLAAIIFLARPLIFQSISIYKENKDKRAGIESYDKNIANIKTVESKIEDISYTIAKSQQFIPKEPDTEDFIVQLEATAQKSKIALTKIDLGEDKQASQAPSSEPTEQQPADDQQSSTNQASQQQQKIVDVAGVEETAIYVDARGEYSRIISFLGNLKKLSRFNIVKNLSIDSSQDQVTFSFYVVIFSKTSQT